MTKYETAEEAMTANANVVTSRLRLHQSRSACCSTISSDTLSGLRHT